MTVQAEYLAADRLANLSDAMFGVAMTLLATTLAPRVEQLSGSMLDVAAALGRPLDAVILSFTVSAVYWVSQQRRLAMTDWVTPAQTVVHLVFLFLIVLLPISTGLFVRNGTTRITVAIFGVHLTLIAAVNLVLWNQLRPRAETAHAVLISALVCVLFLAAFGVGLVRPGLAEYVWYGAFATPLLRRLFRFRGPAGPPPSPSR